jgi:alanine racemase
MFCAPESRLDMVRPGISLYGIDPLCRPSLDRKLRPVMKWTAPLIGIRAVPAGVTVGYGQTFSTTVATKIGLVPVGYADGYLRQFSNKAKVIIQGKAAPVIGRVSMDFLTIDLGEVPQATIGDDVTLLDDDPLSPASIYKLAEWGQTIPYEICCRVGPRVKRIVVDPTERLIRRSASANEFPELRMDE